MPPNLRISWFDQSILNAEDFHIVADSVAFLELGF